MVKDVVNVDSIDSFLVKLEVKEFARFLEFTLIKLDLAFSCKPYITFKWTE
jgi:hypothetical protein